jgi:methionyl-tRNA formyltransferase
MSNAVEKIQAKVLVVGKSNDEHASRALQFLQDNFSEVSFHLGRFGQGKLPEAVLDWQGDYIISYLSPWVVPDTLLKRASRAALNFHPATPDYPGIGCNNFALYDNVTEYGAMCHHMAPVVDTGKVVAVKRFRVFPTDTVASILARTHDHQLSLFYDIMSLVVDGKPIPESTETWSKAPLTRKELNALARVTPEMTKEEVARRIRATSFGAWRPTVEIHGYVFELKEGQ